VRQCVYVCVYLALGSKSPRSLGYRKDTAQETPVCVSMCIFVCMCADILCMCADVLCVYAFVCACVCVCLFVSVYVVFPWRN
jgi:hypothetical protein